LGVESDAVIEVIKTYTSGPTRTVAVALAYRCKSCEKIWPDIINDRVKAYNHECKGKKP
jgi:hypothetical protein